MLKYKLGEIYNGEIFFYLKKKLFFFKFYTICNSSRYFIYIFISWLNFNIMLKFILLLIFKDIFKIILLLVNIF